MQKKLLLAAPMMLVCIGTMLQGMKLEDDTKGFLKAFALVGITTVVIGKWHEYREVRDRVRIIEKHTDELLVNQRRLEQGQQRLQRLNALIKENTELLKRGVADARTDIAHVQQRVCVLDGKAADIKKGVDATNAHLDFHDGQLRTLQDSSDSIMAVLKKIHAQQHEHTEQLGSIEATMTSMRGEHATREHVVQCEVQLKELVQKEAADIKKMMETVATGGVLKTEVEQLKNSILDEHQKTVKAVDTLLARLVTKQDAELWGHDLKQSIRAEVERAVADEFARQRSGVGLQPFPAGPARVTARPLLVLATS